MSALATTSGFRRDALETLLATRSEPRWLSARREAAWDRFAALGMPDPQAEEWMRTDIRLFKLDRFGPALGGDAPAQRELPPPLLAAGVDLGGRVAALDGRTVVSELDARWAQRGVLLGDLSQLAAEHGDLLRTYLDRETVAPGYDKFSALGHAFWTSAAVLYVPPGVRVEQPIHLYSALGDGACDVSRTLIVLAEGAEATVLSETASRGPHDAGLHVGSIELLVEPGARLRYVNLQNWGDKVWHFAHQKAAVAARGGLQWTLGALGSRLAKVNQRVALTGPDAEAQVNGVLFTQGRQHLCYNTHQHHEAPHCRSDLLYKAALQDESRTVWRGMIKVDPVAQRTDAYQRNDNLLLSPTARADSIPGLEIEADDVRCTHGSTSGRVDDEQLFYAMTRGYTRREAVRMIVAGFFQQVFDRITIESVRDALGEAIGSRVRDLQ
jgi:Fe-S cluster assembly protein SufD